jgi:uncharacterized protein YecE (DUF72 family)
LAATENRTGCIRAGIGGWSYEPWRETFYPADVPKAKELHYASRQLTAIEINSTFYRLQKPAVFAKWRDDTPDDFVFTIKAPRYLSYRKRLSEALPYIGRFMSSGLEELGAKLGPILWQLAPEHPFDSGDLQRFLGDLPRSLRHALEVRHESFLCEELVAMARRHAVALVFADSDEYPCVSNATADFVYARLRRSRSSVKTGYTVEELEKWSARARLWASGGEPQELPRIGAERAPALPRDVYLFFINGAKERAPAAARALLSLTPA